MGVVMAVFVAVSVCGVFGGFRKLRHDSSHHKIFYGVIVPFLA